WAVLRCEEPAGYLEEHDSEVEAGGKNAKSGHIGFQLDGHGGKNRCDVVPVDSVDHPRNNQRPKCAAVGHVSQQMLRQAPTRFSYSGSDNSSIDAGQSIHDALSRRTLSMKRSGSLLLRHFSRPSVLVFSRGPRNSNRLIMARIHLCAEILSPYRKRGDVLERQSSARQYGLCLN